MFLTFSLLAEANLFSFNAGNLKEKHKRVITHTQESMFKIQSPLRRDVQAAIFTNSLRVRFISNDIFNLKQDLTYKINF